MSGVLTFTKRLLTPDLLHGYQQKAINFQCQHPQSMLWLDMGLGKTSAALTAIDILMLIGEVSLKEPAIVFAPKRVARQPRSHAVQMVLQRVLLLARRRGCKA